MFPYATRRIVQLVPLLMGIVVVVFGLMQIIPGDPAVVLLGQDATPAAAAELRRALGLDRPLPVQLGIYVANLARGDLGESLFRGEPVSTAIASRLPATMEVALMALAFSVVVGVSLGAAAAAKRGSVVDTASMLVAQLGVSMPVFWLGILLMFVLAVQLGLLPSVGRGPALTEGLAAALRGNPSVLVDSLRYLVLPSLTLGLYGAAVISRMVRATMLETLAAPYVRSASGRGIAGGRVVAIHAMRNALLPVVSVIGLRFGELLGGAVLTESIFGWPGLGQLAVSAISQRDVPLVQGIVLVFAFMFAIVNLLADLLNAKLDPRVGLSSP